MRLLLAGTGSGCGKTTSSILVMACLSLYLGFVSRGVDNIAHVGGLICGFCLALVFYHPRSRPAEESLRHEG